MDFQQFLEARNIDCEQLQPELLAALRSQYEADCRRLAPASPATAEVLVQPIDCHWPQRSYWVPL